MEPVSNAFSWYCLLRSIPRQCPSLSCSQPKVLAASTSIPSLVHRGVIPELPAKCQPPLCRVLGSFAVAGVEPQRGAMSSCPSMWPWTWTGTGLHPKSFLSSVQWTYAHSKLKLAPCQRVSVPCQRVSVPCCCLQPLLPALKVSPCSSQPGTASHTSRSDTFTLGATEQGDRCQGEHVGQEDKQRTHGSLLLNEWITPSRIPKAGRPTQTRTLGPV